MKPIKKISKAKKPMFTVDLTAIDTPDDIVMEFIAAKVRAGLTISEKEMFFTMSYGAITALNAFENFYNSHATVIESDELAQKLLKEIDKALKKKNAWYKRFWNWIKKPFVKK